MANYYGDGDTIQIYPETDLPARSVVVLGGLLGVTKVPRAAGEKTAVHLTGVFEFAKGAGAIDQGVEVFWDAAEGEITTDDDDGANPRAGHAWSAAGASDPTVLVRLAN